MNEQKPLSVAVFAVFAVCACSGAGTGGGGADGGPESGAGFGGFGAGGSSGAGGQGAIGGGGAAGSPGLGGAAGSAGSAGSGGAAGCELVVHPELAPSSMSCCTEIDSSCTGTDRCKVAGSQGTCEPAPSCTAGKQPGDPCTTSAECCNAGVCYQGVCTDQCMLSQGACGEPGSSCVSVSHPEWGVCWPPSQSV